MTSPPQGLGFQTLFDATTDAMLLLDDSGHITHANLSAQQLLAYTEKELCGLAIDTVLPLQYRNHHRYLREDFYHKPEKRPMSKGKALVALRHDGKKLSVDISLSPMKEQGQLYILLTLYVADRRRWAEEALRISEGRLRLAKEAAGLGVFDFDPKHNIIHCDERMRELWGADSDKAVTYEKFIASIHPDDFMVRQAAVDRASDPTSNGEYHSEFRIINPKDGIERWITTVGRMHFEDGHAARLIGVVRDVTKQKMLERKLYEQRAETETLFTQQVAASTASAIAHELNQPLGAISAYSEVALHALQNKAIDTLKLKRALEGCVAQAQRAGQSLHELLAFLQKGELVSEKLDLNGVVKEAIDIARSNGYGGFHPVLQLQPHMPQVLGNRIQVQKILVNLLTNSVEAMRGAGMPSTAITIKVRTNTEMNMAHVTVQDSGPGLDPETVKHIFEPFFTTKTKGIGMGL
ncbi:MAG TPA: PAS domain S-box protein, partial [Methylotenera sp.]|nr:PAS domain S-box protein [Methylotenera sp.]